MIYNTTRIGQLMYKFDTMLNGGAGILDCKHSANSFQLFT